MILKGISYSQQYEEKLIHRYYIESEIFKYSGFKDLAGQAKWKGYDISTPDFRVIELTAGKCITDEEVVFTKDNEVVEEITSQHNNPYVGKSMELEPDEIVKGTVLCLYMGGLDTNYYHFNVEFLMRWWLYKLSDIEVDYYLCSSETKFAKSFYKLMDIENKILRYDKGTVIQCERLIVPSLINNWEMHRSINWKPLYWKLWLPSWGKDAYSWIKERLLLPKESATGRIYISRNHSDRRIIENENELLPILKENGFVVKYLEEMSVEEQIECFDSANVVIAPHGAGLVNISYCKPNTTILELYPRNYHDPSFRLQAQLMNFKYNYIVCKKSRAIKLNEKPDCQNIRLSKKDIARIVQFISDLC